MRVERARYLLAAIETGSLRAAAARCGISQPALSQQVSLLEEELDLVLLTRSQHGVRPTAAGQTMVEALRQLVAAEDATLAAAASAGGAVSGAVTIGAISVVVETLVAAVVARLRADHADLRFSIFEASSSQVEAGVVAGDVDFGVITALADPPQAGLRRTTLFRAPLGIVVRADHPLADRREATWEHLAAWPIVTMRTGTVMWERLHQNVADPHIVVQAMSARSVKLMVSQGAGVGVLAPFVSASDVPGLRWIRLRDNRLVEVCLVQRSDTRPSASALTVKRLIVQQASVIDRQMGELGR